MRQGYYFASSQEASQRDIAKAAGTVLKSHGIIETAEPKSVSLDQARGMMSEWGYSDIGTYMFAANSRTRAHRAQKVLGYEPKAPTLWEAMEADLLAAAK